MRIDKAPPQTKPALSPRFRDAKLRRRSAGYPLRPPVITANVAYGKAGIQRLVAVGYRTRKDRPQSLNLLIVKTVCFVAPQAHQALWIEMASARILDKSIDHAIQTVALGRHRLVDKLNV